MVNHVGNPWMFDGNMFFPETGTPIWKMARIKTLFAVWLPEPLMVATWMLKSLMTGCRNSPERGEAGETSIVDIYMRNPSLGCSGAHWVELKFVSNYTPPDPHRWPSGRAVIQVTTSPAGRHITTARSQNTLD